jgi:hypothetical protein
MAFRKIEVSTVQMPSTSAVQAFADFKAEARGQIESRDGDGNGDGTVRAFAVRTTSGAVPITNLGLFYYSTWDVQRISNKNMAE